MAQRNLTRRFHKQVARIAQAQEPSDLQAALQELDRLDAELMRALLEHLGPTRPRAQSTGDGAAAPALALRGARHRVHPDLLPAPVYDSDFPSDDDENATLEDVASKQEERKVTDRIHEQAQVVESSLNGLQEALTASEAARVQQAELRVRLQHARLRVAEAHVEHHNQSLDVARARDSRDKLCNATDLTAQSLLRLASELDDAERQHRQLHAEVPELEAGARQAEAAKRDAEEALHLAEDAARLYSEQARRQDGVLQAAIANLNGLNDCLKSVEATLQAHGVVQNETSQPLTQSWTFQPCAAVVAPAHGTEQTGHMLLEVDLQGQSKRPVHARVQAPEDEEPGSIDDQPVQGTRMDSPGGSRDVDEEVGAHGEVPSAAEVRRVTGGLREQALGVAAAARELRPLREHAAAAAARRVAAAARYGRARAVAEAAYEKHLAHRKLLEKAELERDRTRRARERTTDTLAGLQRACDQEGLMLRGLLQTLREMRSALDATEAAKRSADAAARAADAAAEAADAGARDEARELQGEMLALNRLSAELRRLEAAESRRHAHPAPQVRGRGCRGTTPQGGRIIALCAVLLSWHARGA